MLSSTPRRLAISLYSAFLRSGVHEKIKEYPFAQRGAILSEMYRNLTPKEQKELHAIAKQTKYQRLRKDELVMPPKPVIERPSLLTDYQVFVRSNIKKMEGLPKERMTKVALAWRNRDRKA